MGLVGCSLATVKEHVFMTLWALNARGPLGHIDTQEEGMEGKLAGVGWVNFELPMEGSKGWASRRKKVGEQPSGRNRGS